MPTPPNSIVRCCSKSMKNVQDGPVLSPQYSPFHPTKNEPGSGVAVNVIVTP